MSEIIGERRTASRRASHILIALLVGPVTVHLGSAAHAGAIHHPRIHATVKAESAEVSISAAMVSAEAVMEKWDPYFAYALEHHLMNVHGPNAVKLLSVMVEGEGGLPNNAFVQYLEWRHGLNVERFDANHPGLGPLLESSQLVTAAAVPPKTSDATPPILGQGINPPPVVTSPPSKSTTPIIEGQAPQVPEPASLLIAGVMVGSAFVARRWNSTRP